MTRPLTIHERHMKGILVKHAKENAGVEQGINICMDAAMKIRKAAENLLVIYGKPSQAGLYNASAMEQKVELSINTIKNHIKLLQVTWGSNDVGFIRKFKDLISKLEDTNEIEKKIEYAQKIIETAAKTYEKLKTFLTTDQLIEREMQSLGAREEALRREMGNWLG